MISVRSVTGSLMPWRRTILRLLPIPLILGSSLLMPPPVGSTHGHEGPCLAPSSYEVVGTASNYPGTAGWVGQPTVALPLVLGGCYTGEVHGSVVVCAERCVTLPVVDFCDCYWGKADQRVVDLSWSAWELVTDKPLSAGLVRVRVIHEATPAQREAPTTSNGTEAGTTLPDTATR